MDRIRRQGVLKGSEDIQATGPKFYNQKDTMYTYHQAGVGDTNGDGFNDIVAMYAGTGGESNGGARLYLGEASSLKLAGVLLKR